MAAELRAFSQAGGKVLFGTDVGYTDDLDTALEFTLVARAGSTPRKISLPFREFSSQFAVEGLSIRRIELRAGAIVWIWASRR